MQLRTLAAAALAAAIALSPLRCSAQAEDDHLPLQRPRGAADARRARRVRAAQPRHQGHHAARQLGRRAAAVPARGGGRHRARRRAPRLRVAALVRRRRRAAAARRPHHARRRALGAQGWDDFFARDLAVGADGKIYGVPWTTDTFALIYNKDLFAAGRAIAEFPHHLGRACARRASAIQQSTGKAGLGFPAGSCGTPTIWFYCNFYWWSKGPGLIDRGAGRPLRRRR